MWLRPTYMFISFWQCATTCKSTCMLSYQHTVHFSVTKCLNLLRYEKNSGLLHINYFDKAIKSSILEVSRRWQQDSITKMRVCSVTARKLRLLTQPPGPSLQTSCYWACWFSWHHVTHTHVLHCYALANLFSSFSMKVYIQ